jgi:16S rRNA (uracil1498-N3)-methyltransferase
MRLHRFYVSQPLGEEVVIEDVSLIKQWTKVFRYTETDFVVLFNGDGYDVTYSLDSVTTKKCTLRSTKRTSSYIPTKKLSLYLSLIKKDNFELVVQKATELGVTTIIPIISERSEKKNLNEDRLLKISIEASEQCGRGDVPVITPIISLDSALTTLSSQTEQHSLFLQMGGLSWRDAKIQNMIMDTNPLNLFIGPEGGWSDQEEALFTEHSLTSVSLGNTVLRAETAAIVACGLLGN